MNTVMFDQEKYRLVTGYARYLLEYLAIKFDKKGDA